MSKSHHAAPFEIRSPISPRHLTDLGGRTAPVPDPARVVHLQFRRFAGCPVCNLHLHSFARRHAELAEAGVHEIVVFHSSASELRKYIGDLPFTVIPDPAKKLYAQFGVTSSLRALLDPRVWVPIVSAVAFALKQVVFDGARMPTLKPEGGRWGLPADFLIATDGRVIAHNYGKHADDHWSVDEVLALVRGHR